MNFKRSSWVPTFQESPPSGNITTALVATTATWAASTATTQTATGPMHGTTNVRPILTWREEKLLKVLQKHQRIDGSFPTMRKLALLMGLNTHSGVAIAMERLCLKGYLFRRPGRLHSNTHNGRLYSLTPIVEEPPKLVTIYLTSEGRFSHYSTSPNIKVSIKRT